MTIATLLLALVPAAPEVPGLPGLAELPELDGRRLNEIQVIGTHNSYKLEIQPELLRGMLDRSPAAASLDYRHRPLPDQLDLGVRNLELDLYSDPVGGHYASPYGQRALEAMGVRALPFNTEGELDTPGIKVMHDCNFDFRSHTLRLEDTLAGLRYWSAMNPGHLPVFVTLNLKQGGPPLPGAIDPIEWDASSLDALDAALVAGLGWENLVLPDDVRGAHARLGDAIAADGWPDVAACRGRFVFIIDEGGRLAQIYAEGRPGLEGRAMFTASPADSPDTVFRVMNEPRGNEDAIRAEVARGRIVRTRADAGTSEMREGDLSRFEAAMASGAQIITTDYPEPDTRHHATYRVVFPGGGYARPNPFSPMTDDGEG